jgi:hypothetical protein
MADQQAIEMMNKRLRVALAQNNWDMVRQVAVFSIRTSVIEEAFFERLYSHYGKQWEKLDGQQPLAGPPPVPPPTPPPQVGPPAMQPAAPKPGGCGCGGQRPVSTTVRNV